MVEEKENAPVEWSPQDMLEVTLNEPDDFLKVKETLTRIGIASRKDKKLYQSCHILHKQGRYFITHFKELFLLDGNKSTLELSDIQRRNTIAMLLSDWGLLRSSIKKRQMTLHLFVRLKFFHFVRKTNGSYFRNIT